MPRLQPTWLLSITLVAHGAASPRPALAALDPGTRISQYAHTAWRVRDGFLGSAPRTVGQTTDGYLWVGTDGGLVRFDGVRFVPWAAPRDTPLPSNTVLSLLGARDGSLWIGTAGGPAHWTNGRLVRFPEVGGRINSILEDDAGAIWIARSRLSAVQGAQGPLCRFHEGAFRCYGEAEGIACATGAALAKDTNGALWMGGADGLCRWNQGPPVRYLQRELAQASGTTGISSLAAGREGGLFVGIYARGAALGLRQFMDGSSSRYALPGLDGSGLSVSTLLVDGNDSLWIGTTDDGLYRVAGGHAEHFRSADGLSSDSVARLYQDREGALWVVTSKGIDRFRDYRVTTLSAREGLTGDNVSSVVASADGTVWIGNLGALDVLRGRTVSSVAADKGLPGANVTSLFEDRGGRLWVGVDNSLFAYEGGRFLPVRTRVDPFGIVVALTDDAAQDLWAEVAGGRTGLVRIRGLEEQEFVPSSAAPRATVLAADPREGIWLGTRDGGLGRYRRGAFEDLSSTPGAPRGRIRGIVVDSDGTVWTAGPAGLTRWQGGAARTLDSRQGLPCDDVFALIRDDRGALWLYTACGLVAVAGSELERWSASPGVVAVKTLDILDGAQPALTTFQPAAARSPDGRLWFVNDTFLQWIDPSHLEPQGKPPAVHVEQLIADGRTYGPGDALRLPPLTREIQVDYTATRLTMPEKVRFRYKLEGKDADWQHPGTRRQAFYNDLPPGAYRFRVLAATDDGVWNESGAALDFAIRPAYFQTAWFRAGLVASAIAVLWMIYLMRLRQLTAATEARMATRLAERERIAREVHDTLLQGLNGLILKFQAIADRITPSEPARAMMEQALDRAEQAVSEGRSLVEGLRTRDRDGIQIVEALRDVGRELAQDGGSRLEVVVEGRPRPLHVVVADEVYWVAREALINAFHAAQATHIELELSYARKELRLRVRDDGTGIDPAVLQSGGRPGHWGIRGMRERAARIGARLEISSRPGAGTEVDLCVGAGVAYRRESGASRWRWPAWPFGGAGRRGPE